MQIVVLGLGNILLGDEGVGVHALNMLKEHFPDPSVRYYDGGTRGLLLLPFLEEASHLLILDAVRSDDKVGKLVELRGKDLVTSVPSKFSAHDIALPDLLALLRFKKQDRLQVVLLGTAIESYNFSTELSSTTKGCLTELIRRAEQIVEGWLVMEDVVESEMVQEKQA
jgi:hydrogenase maturation protease